jgi:hypothetical protein
MHSFACRRFLSSLVAVVMASGSLLYPQTLQRRPVPQPETPPAAREDAMLLPPKKPVLPVGTSFQVEIAQHYSMKVGVVLDGRLLHPIYFDGRLVVAENTPVRGRVAALEAAPKTRWHARLRGDFTPFHTVRVQFNELLLPGGPLPMESATAADGAPVLRLRGPGSSPKRSRVARYWLLARNRVQDRVAYFTAPGLGDRTLQLLYHQLPYHPERIEAHTAWSFELMEPLPLGDIQTTAPVPAHPATATEGAETWNVHALLLRNLTSAHARPGDPVEALVVEPVYDRESELVVPQGSRLIGKVTAAKAARFFGRNGKLRFAFQQVRFPEGSAHSVQGSLAGASTEKPQDLTLDAEGTVSPRSQSSVIAPLLLTMLAGRALDEDGNLFVGTGVASNGLGFVGRIVGVAAKNRNLAAGIGFYAAGLSVYENFLRSGHDVVFPKDTWIEIETSPLRAPVLKPTAQ